jgi:hypothetical protein
MPEMAIPRPCGELDLGDEHRFNPACVARFGPRHVDEWSVRPAVFLKQGDEFAAELLAEAGPDRAGVAQIASAVVAD